MLEDEEIADDEVEDEEVAVDGLAVDVTKVVDDCADAVEAGDVVDSTTELTVAEEDAEVVTSVLGDSAIECEYDLCRWLSSTSTTDTEALVLGEVTTSELERDRAGEDPTVLVETSTGEVVIALTATAVGSASPATVTDVCQLAVASHLPLRT